MSKKPFEDKYIMSDQPECCRHCGTRTNFLEIMMFQAHVCPNCDYSYLLYEDMDEDAGDRP